MYAYAHRSPMSLKMSVELGGTWMHCSKIPHILKNQLSRISEVDVCVCVCVRERERERVCVCVCLFLGAAASSAHIAVW